MNEREAQGEGTDVQTPPVARADGSAPPAGSREPKQVGIYEIIEQVGQGGMARVYKAFDPSLQRLVALKIIEGDDPELRERLSLEAKAQARIQHPHICEVYATGQIDGRTYIAMKFIDGKTLDEMMLAMTVEQKVKVMKEVAEAVHEAHRIGLIHRDIKPGNVMIERTPDGLLFPYVLDFGVVRELETPGLTQTGIILGTPWYMAPEQAKGEVRKLDRRTDVYSLGATLYHALIGRTPFEADSTFDVLTKIVNEEPPPMRLSDRSLPADLDTIALKAMEKDPERRYDSAKAFADDLQRYLDGEPIAARPTSVGYRLYRKALKHKAVVAMMAAALALILVLAGVAVRARLAAEEQARLAHRFGQDLKEVESVMRISAMLPLHSIVPEKRRVRSLMLQILQEMKRAGKSGLGPGEYALGRGALALGDNQPARAHLEAAWKSGYREPEVAYSLGLVLGRLYRDEEEQAAKIPSADLRKRRERELDEQLRFPAISYLKQGGRIETEAPEYAEALLRYYSKQWNPALTRADQAIRRLPWLFEAIQLRGDVFKAQAIEKTTGGKYAEALQLFARADGEYLRSIEIARSDPEVRRARCHLWALVMQTLNQTSGDPSKAFETAKGACREAVLADPESAEAWDRTGFAWSQWGDYQVTRGEDPTPAYHQSIAEASKAIALAPRKASGYRTLGYSCLGLASYITNRGDDPTVLMQRAIANYRRALELEKNDYVGVNNIGYAYANLAFYKDGIGQDPEPLLKQALPYFQRSAALDPKSAIPVYNVGLIYKQLETLAILRGRNPDEWKREALASYRKAIAINPSYAYAYSGFGEGALMWSQYELWHGHDPQASIEEAIRNFDNAIRLAPKFEYLYQNRGETRYTKALVMFLSGGDPGEQIDAAVRDFEKCLEVNPSWSFAHQSWANADILRARWNMSRGVSPAASLDSADQHLQKARALNSTLPLDSNHAMAELVRAEWDIHSGASPLEHFARARTHIVEAVKVTPLDSDVYRLRAEIALREAAWKTSRGEAAESEVTEGLTAVQQGRRVNATRVEFSALEGALLLQRAAFTRSESLHAEARAKLEAALRANRYLQFDYREFL